MKMVHAAGYYLTLALFGLGGLLLNLVCWVAGWCARGPRTERFVQRVIRRHFQFFVVWLRVTRLCRVVYRGTAARPRDSGVVFIANHPCLMDATFLLARVPEAFCIFKPAIRRNPILGAAAVCAGYLQSDAGVDLIRQAADKVGAGQNLLVFPEGTRTPYLGRTQAFRPGFAVIAHRAAARIQLIHLAFDSNVLVKGARWWRPPVLPAHARVEFGPVIEPGARSASDVAAQAEAWFETRSPWLDRGCGNRAGATQTVLSD